MNSVSTTVTPSGAASSPAAPPAASHPLIERLAALPGAQWVTPLDLESWRNRPGAQVLLLAGDPVRHPEGLDVAVVLPELQAALGGAFGIGVAARADDAALAARFGVQRWPNLVVLRDGAYLGTVPGMHDWSDFVGLMREALQRAPQRIPSVGIPVVAAATAPSAGSCA